MSRNLLSLFGIQVLTPSVKGATRLALAFAPTMLANTQDIGQVPTIRMKITMRIGD